MKRIEIQSHISEQIDKIEKEIRETPYHKGTEHHIGKLRAKLSKLKDKQIESIQKGGGGGGGYAIKKQGDATVVLIGPPSAGKSTLLNKLTNARSKIAPYEFTTVSVIPGMMEYKTAKIQILDVPGVIEGAEKGKGRGREVLSVARGADLLLIMCDVERAGSFDKITSSLDKVGIRINRKPSDITIEKRLKGGIIIHSNIKQDLDIQTIKGIAKEFGLANAEITLKEKFTLEKIIDAFSKNRVYIPAIYVINKIDLRIKTNLASRQTNYVAISSLENIGLDGLKELIWETLGFISVYLVRPDQEPSFQSPIVMKINNSLSDVAEKLGTEFSEEKKKAKIWGKGAKFPGQEVSLSTKVVEGMQIRFI